MAITIRGSSDEELLSIQQTLLPYGEQYPDAAIELYRQNSISIRIRVVDPTFDNMEKSDRHSRIWAYLESLPEDLQSDISMVVLLTPAETKRSMANLEFEDPAPSLIQ
jgi:hypothetical protein